MSHRRAFRLGLLVLPLVVLALAGTSLLAMARSDIWVQPGRPLASSRGAVDPAKAIERAWQAAQAAGTFRLTSDVQQTLTPRPLPRNAGKGDTLSAPLHVEGEVMAPDRARLTLTVGGGRATMGNLPSTSSDSALIRLLLVQQRAFIGHAGSWRLIENPLGAAAPVADALSLLTMARDVQYVGQAAGADHYRFVLDGPAYAAAQRARIQALVQQQLPPGIEVQTPRQYQRMVGAGEVWVDAAGLPRRIVLTMTLPEVNATQDAQVRMQVDYRDFGAAIAPIEAPTPGGPDGMWTVAAEGDAVAMAAEPAAATAALAETSAPVMGHGLWLFMAGVALLTVVWRRRRAVYTAVAVTVMVSMVATPLLQAAQVVRFTETLQAGETLTEALSQLGLAPAITETDALAELAQAFSGPVGMGQPGQAMKIDGVQDCTVMPEGIDPHGDDDSDGLTNAAERCLGTDYKNWDTDGDTITDTLELQGFKLPNSTTIWTTDPLQRDSNHDGMDDAQEWNPKWVQTNPQTLDYDGDGIPNAWDDDNDNDGVPDGPDLSPYKVLSYQSSYSINITKPQNDPLHKDSYVYVNLQLQPQDASHLRYTTTFLDWPYDNQAQIQDLDSSTDDIQLIPMLSLQSPTQMSLAPEYGVLGKNENNQYYEYLVPLTTVEVNGNIAAFSARLAFTPDEAATAIQLSQARLGWLAQAKLDQQKCVRNFNNICVQWGVDTTKSVVVSYYEPQMRVVGLNVVESRDVAVGLFGVPSAPEISTGSTPDEEREVFNLVSGMGLSYLAALQPDLPALVGRFTNSNTPPDQKWGVTLPVKTAYNTFAHQDQAMATTVMTTTPTFLNTNYAQSRKPTLVVAYEETTGSLGIEKAVNQGVTIQEGNGTTSVSFSLSYNAMLTLRQVQVQMYHWGQNSQGQTGWQGLSMNDALAELNRRYSFSGQTATERYIKVLFLTWYSGLVNYVEVNGKPLVGAQADDQAIFNLLNQPSQNSLPGYVRAAYHLDDLATFVNANGPAAGFQEWLSTTWGGQSSSVRAGAVPIIMAFGGIASMALPYLRLIPQGIRWASRLASGAAEEAAEVAEGASGAAEGAADAAAAGAKALGRLAIGIAVIVAVVQLIQIWSSFHGYSDDVSHLQTDMELSNDIAATILVVLGLLIAIITVAVADTGVGLLVELVIAVLLYLIVALITGDWNPLHTYNFLTEWIADFLVKIAFYAELDQNNPVQSSGLNVTFGDPDKGTVAGNSVTYDVNLTTTVVVGPGDDEWNWVHSRHGNADDVRDSYAYTRWVSSDAGATHQYNGCQMSGSSANCHSTVSATFTPQQAARNVAIHVTSVIDFSLRYQKCWWAVVVRTCSADSATDSSPKSSDTDAWNQATQPIYVDVLPNSVSALWTWNQITNPDKDGDGVADSQEAALGTNPTLWDTDGDGLSDGWERDNRVSLGTDPTRADTDGDGLNDALEIALGTLVATADSDKDGLKDGEEVCHLDRSSGTPRMVGGWLVGGYRVCSNPLDPDADGDDLYDSQERHLSLSPFAPNTAPGLGVTVQQPLTPHAGDVLHVLKPGDTLTAQFGLVNDTAATIDQPLQVCGLSAAFAAPSVVNTQTSGGYNAPSYSSQTQGATICGVWNFGQKPLHSGEGITVTWRSQALASSASYHTSVDLSLSYKDPTDSSTKEITRTIPVIIDADNPQTLISAPSNNPAIKGTSYVIAGTASDPTTWINGVTVAVDGVVNPTAANGAESWAWTWHPLPADGVYTVRATSTDQVGHQSAPVTATVIVDNTAPGAVFTSVSNNQVLSGLTQDSLGGATVTLRGTSTDLLSGAPQVAGVAAVELSIDGRPWETVAEYRAPYPQTTTWSWAWKFDAATTGSRLLAVRAVDALGQIGQAQTVNVIVDVLPPTDSISNYVTDVKANQPLTILGHADDTGNVPLPARPAPLTGLLDSVVSSTIRLEPQKVGDLAGVTTTWLGDMNGDGRADAAIGMPAYNGGSGRVVIVHGQPGGWPVPPEAAALADTDSSLIASGATGLGSHIAPAGDVNGDGIFDLLVGDPTNSLVYVVFGQIGPQGRDWDLANLRSRNQSTRGVILTASTGTLGAWLAAAGDVNGDGLGDLLIGATDPQRQNNHLYLVMGQRRFTSPSIDIVGTAAAVFPIDPQGAVATGVGDMNGDTYADFIVTDPNNTFGANSGAVYLFYGSPTFQVASRLHQQQSLNPRTNANATFSGPGRIGAQAIALGDVNGDHLTDFLFSEDNNRVLVLGRSNGAPQPGPLWRNYPTDSSGYMAAVGDVNADGLNDFVLGTGGNKASLILGAAAIPNPPSVAATLTNAAGVASAPYAAGADLNCDMSSDLLITPPGTATGLKRTELSFGQPPYIAQANLPMAGVNAPQKPGEAGQLLQAAKRRVTAAQPAAVVYVAPGYCATCANDGRQWGIDAFASIQTAINSGSRQVRLEPGVYQEAFRLANGVQVIGAGADATILTLPPGSSTPIVTADNISGATLGRVTLAGASSVEGLRVQNGAKTIKLLRAIVRNAGTAVHVDGAQSAVQLVNTTLVNNTNGVTATSCGAFDVRNSIFAFNTGSGLNYQSCATTKLHTYNLFWRNGQDMLTDGAASFAPGAGEIFADPRFTRPSQNDFRPQPGSPVMEAGDPYDPSPPGTDIRIDIGYVQVGQASFYADDNYCETCVNDGLDWQVDAFNKVQDALDAASRHQQLVNANCAVPSALCQTQFTVGVGPGTYTERVTVPSNIRLVGSGAEQTILNGGGGGSLVTLNNVTQVEVSGFTLTGTGAATGAAGVLAIGSTSFVTITRNIIRGNSDGIGFSQGATGAVLNNTIVSNNGAGVSVNNAGTWVSVRDNIIANHSFAGVFTEAGSQVFNDYNLFHGNANDYLDTGNTGLKAGQHDIVGQDPQFVNASANDYSLKAISPAVDAGDPPAPVPAGGGAQVDIGYRELLAMPLTLILGKEGTTCAMAASGIASVEVGLTRVLDASLPITATVPTSWITGTVSTPGQPGSYWTATVTPNAGDGYYRLYSRAKDTAGNMMTDPSLWYRNTFMADGTPPSVTWTGPSNGSTLNAAALTLTAHASDYVLSPYGSRFNVDTVHFVVDGQVVPADPVGDARAADTGQGRSYRSATPLAVGAHTVSVVARDRAGNQTQTDPQTITIQQTTDVATITSPADSVPLTSTTVLVKGHARFVSASGTGQVTIYVDSQPAGTATLDNPNATETTWSASITLAAGSHSVAAVASRTAPGSLLTATPVNVIVSTGLPSVSITQPPDGYVAGQTVPLTGRANGPSNLSPLVSVRVSLDSGATWLPATIDTHTASWSLTWTPKPNTDHVEYPVMVRAVDAAGNQSTVSQSVIVDSLGPIPFEPVTLTPGIGTHLTAPGQATVHWTPSRDGSGSVTMLAEFSPTADTIPTQVVTGTSFTARFPYAGTWYIHVAARDATGNITLRHYGPWYVGS